VVATAAESSCRSIRLPIPGRVLYQFFSRFAGQVDSAAAAPSAAAQRG
jgi:hypothetical protein